MPKRKRTSADGASVLDRKYGSQDYWDSRYQARLAPLPAQDDKKVTKANDDDVEEMTEEWYYSFEQLKDILEDRFLSIIGDAMSMVLDLGCGVSTFGSDMRKEGFVGTYVGVDSSPTAIHHMQSTYSSECTSGIMRFLRGDIFNLTKDFPIRESFDMILDKATSDGLMSSPVNVDKIEKIYAEVSRLLKPGGLFLCVSVTDPEDEWFSDTLASTLLAHGDGYRFRADVHSLGAENVSIHEEGGGPNVYIIQKSKRRSPRVHKRQPSVSSSSSMFTVKQVFHE